MGTPLGLSQRHCSATQETNVCFCSGKECRTKFQRYLSEIGENNRMDVNDELLHSWNSGGGGGKCPREQRKSRRTQNHVPTTFLNRVDNRVAWAS